MDLASLLKDWKLTEGRPEQKLGKFQGPGCLRLENNYNSPQALQSLRQRVRLSVPRGVKWGKLLGVMELGGLWEGCKEASVCSLPYLFPEMSSGGPGQSQ